MDELADPAAEEAKLRRVSPNTRTFWASGAGVEILFGSGYWAQWHKAQHHRRWHLPVSRHCITAAAHHMPMASPEDIRSAATEASGLHHLLRAVATRIADGPGARMVDGAARRGAQYCLDDGDGANDCRGEWQDHDAAGNKQRPFLTAETGTVAPSKIWQQTRRPRKPFAPRAGGLCRKHCPR